jgi:CMP-N,N'-diacetyllegionaminic acid synthase
LHTLALIPARGGSKGIPRKNIKLLAGKPLIAWSIEAALASNMIDSVVVSTDDEEIAEVSLKWGAQVPFIRPAELAQDDTPGIAPVLHALDQLPQFDRVVLLQPTSPLRTVEDINLCIDLAEREGLASVVSVCEPDFHPYWTYILGADLRLTNLIDTPTFSRRQDVPTVYGLNGALYLAHVDFLRKHQSFLTPETIGFVMPKERSLDVDSLFDWKLAEFLISERT